MTSPRSRVWVPERWFKIRQVCLWLYAIMFEFIFVLEMLCKRDYYSSRSLKRHSSRYKIWDRFIWHVCGWCYERTLNFHFGWRVLVCIVAECILITNLNNSNQTNFHVIGYIRIRYSYVSTTCIFYIELWYSFIMYNETIVFLSTKLVKENDLPDCLFHTLCLAHREMRNDRIARARATCAQK